MYKLVFVFVFLFSEFANARDVSFVDKIRSRGYVNCGVSSADVVGFFESKNSEYTGFDVDFCRAFSVAIFGEIKSVNFVSLSFDDRFDALISNKIDVLTRFAAGRRSRDLERTLETPVTYFIDGIGVMVHEDSNVLSLKDINGVTICEHKGSNTFQYFKSYFSSRNIKYNSKAYNKSSAMKKAFINKKCDALITDRSLLADIRMKNPKIKNAKILNEIVRLETLGPMVSYGNDTWSNIVKWVVLITILAEELGIDSVNIDEKIQENDFYVEEFFSGIEGYKDIGLDKDWVYNIIKKVGNYSEIYARNFGVKSKLKLDRGLNNLWLNEGLLFSPRL